MIKTKTAMFVTASVIAIAASLPMRAQADTRDANIAVAQNNAPESENKNEEEKDDNKRRDGKQRGENREGKGEVKGNGEGRENKNRGEGREGRNDDGEKGDRSRTDRDEKRSKDPAEENRDDKKDEKRDANERNRERDKRADPPPPAQVEKSTTPPVVEPKKVVEPPVLEKTLPRVLNAPVINNRDDDRDQDARKDQAREKFGDRNRRDDDDNNRNRGAARNENTNDDRNKDRDRNRGPLNAAPVGKPGPSFSINDIKSKRRERQEAGGRTVIEEPGNRVIYKQNNKFVIQKDETERVRRLAPNAKFERRDGGRNVSIVDRPNGVQIFTETDERGQLVRRYRKDRRGKEHVIIDNRRRNRSGRDLAIGVGIGAGVVAGAAIFDSLVRVPPPRVRIPRDRYILRYEGASDEDVYEALSAPPVDYVERRYTLDQVRSTPYLRDRMRRVDLDDINFAFGSSEVDPSQYRKLDRVARAMNRIIRRNPDEVFLIEGHTDAVGSTIDNLSLSDRRAESVAVILSQEYGVPFENLVTQGYGEEFLKILTQAPEVVNRRVAARRITPLIGEREVSGGPPIYNERGDRGDDRSDYSDGADDEPRDRDDRNDRNDEPYDDRRDRPRY